MSPPEFLRRLRAYPAAEWPWMVEAGLSLAWARFLIRFIPFRFWRFWMGPIGHGAGLGELTGRNRIRALMVRRWIRRVAANAPFRAVCLPQAMAARWMLGRRGIATELHLGARTGRGDAQPFDLHAWLLCGDLCLTGADARDSFAPFAPPDCA